MTDSIDGPNGAAGLTMAAIARYQPLPEVPMPAQAEQSADFAYDYPKREPTYHGGASSGVAPHWVGVPGADPAMSWADLPTAVRRFMIAARGRVPDSVVRPDHRTPAPAEQWEAWLLKAGADRVDQGDRFLALRTTIDMWPEIATSQILPVARNSYGPEAPVPQQRPAPQRRRGRW